MKQKKHKFRNIGPKSQVWLDKIGVHTPEDLDRIGPERAYELIIEKGHYPHICLLYALIGAHIDEDWKEIAHMVRDGIIKIKKDDLRKVSRLEL